MTSISLDNHKAVFHKTIISVTRKQGVLAFIASLVSLFALTAIISAVICLVCFSGLNVIHQVVFPVIFPSCLVLVCVSLPLMIYVFKSYKKITSQLKDVAQESLRMLKSFYQQTLIKPDKKALAAFIEANIIDIQENKFYRQEFLRVIKDCFPNKKIRSQEDEELIIGIDRAIENLQLSERQRQKRDEKESK